MNYQKAIASCHQAIIACENCLKLLANMECRDECLSSATQCIEACKISITMMKEKSAWASDYLDICAAICTWCASEYASSRHTECGACAKICIACAHDCSLAATLQSFRA